MRLALVTRGPTRQRDLRDRSEPMRRVIVWVVGLVCVSSSAFADDKKPKEPPAYPLKFGPAPELPNGKVSFWRGMAKPAPGDRFFTENLLVLQPITVGIQREFDNLKHTYDT